MISKDDLNSRLVIAEPISFYWSEIHQPTVEELVKLTDEIFQKYIFPFAINLDFLNISEEDKQHFKIFDLFFMRNILSIENVDMLFFLSEALKFFFKTEEVIVNEESNTIFIDNKTIINRDNFEELQEIILKICCREKLKAEKPPVFTSERQRDIHNKLMAGRKRQADKNNLTLADIMKAVRFGGQSILSRQEIKEMTLYELYDSYKSIIALDSYNREYQLYIAGVEPSKLNIETHWTQQIKIEAE